MTVVLWHFSRLPRNSNSLKKREETRADNEKPRAGKKETKLGNFCLLVTKKPANKKNLAMQPVYSKLLMIKIPTKNVFDLKSHGNVNPA